MALKKVKYADGGLLGGKVKIQNVDGSIKEVDTESDEYKQLYNSGKLVSQGDNNTVTAPDLKEVDITAQAPEFLKLKRAEQDKMPVDKYIDENLPKFARQMGVNKDNLQGEDLQGYNNLIDKNTASSILLNHPQGNKSRVEYLNSLSPQSQELVQNNNPQFNPTSIDQTKRGLQSLTEGNPAEYLNNISNNKDFTIKEKQEMLARNPLLAKVADIFKVGSALDIPGKAIQGLLPGNQTVLDGLKGKDNSLPSALTTLIDPLNYTGLGEFGKLGKIAETEKGINAVKSELSLFDKLQEFTNTAKESKLVDSKRNNESKLFDFNLNEAKDRAVRYSQEMKDNGRSEFSDGKRTNHIPGYDDAKDRYRRYSNNEINRPRLSSEDYHTLFTNTDIPFTDPRAQRYRNELFRTEFIDNTPRSTNLFSRSIADDSTMDRYRNYKNGKGYTDSPPPVQNTNNNTTSTPYNSTSYDDAYVNRFKSAVKISTDLKPEDNKIVDDLIKRKSVNGVSFADTDSPVKTVTNFEHLSNNEIEDKIKSLVSFREEHGSKMPSKLKDNLNSSLIDLHGTNFIRNGFKQELIDKGLNPTSELSMFTVDGSTHLINKNNEIVGTISRHNNSVGASGVNNKFQIKSGKDTQGNVIKNQDAINNQYGEALYRGVSNGMKETLGEHLQTGRNFATTYINGVSEKRAEKFWGRQIEAGNAIKDWKGNYKFIKAIPPITLAEMSREGITNKDDESEKKYGLGGNLDNDNTNNNSMANRMDMRKMMFRKIYADGGSLVGLGSSILDNVGQNADGTTNSGTSFLSGALKYGSMGATLGPIGAIGGGLVGGLVDLFSSQNKNNAIDRQKSDNEMKYKTAEQNRTNSQIRLANTNVGNTGTYYGMGGSMRFGQGGNVEAMSGGEMQPIAPNVQEAVGLKHSQGGIDVQTPNGKQAQVEGGEVIKDNDEVFSDQLKTENGMTYAQVAKEVADSSEYKILKGKIDVAKRVMNNPNSNEFAKNAAKREIEKNPDPLDALFQQQEQAKQQQTVQTAGNVNNTPQQNPQQMQDPQQQQMSQQQQPTMAAGGTISKPDLDDVETESDAHRMARTYGDFDMPDNTMQTPNASPFNIKDALQGIGQNLGKYDYNKIVPYLDNFVNAKTTANTPQLPTPTYINPAQYNTQYDVSAPLNVIKTQSAAAIQGINNSSSNSNTSRINAANIFTKGIDESNNLYGSKIYAENEMKNRQVGENQRVMEHNAQMLDQHNNNNYERSIGIQNQVNKNAANAVGDFEKQNLEHLTKVKDQQALFLETQKYKDSGVLERADVARTMDLIQQGHTVSQAKTMIQQEKEAKQKEQDKVDEEEARINSTRSKNRRFDRLQVPTSGLLNSMNSSMSNFNR